MNTAFRSLVRSVAGALVVAILAVVASGLAAGPGAAKPPASLAKLLAADVAKPQTKAQRYRAVLRLMQELHVPVFTAAGKQLAPGARGLPRDFNLYDFQLRAVADGFGRTIGAEELAALFSTGGKRISAATASNTLLRGVRAAVARPSAPASTVGLLVRELGLRHRPASDPALNLAAGKLTLDPLQTLLIIADSSVRKGAARRVAAVDGAAGSPCEQTASFGERLLGVAGLPIGPALPIWKLVSLNHQLSLSTELTRTQGVHETHYGPPGHAPFAGRRLKIGIHAEVTEDFPDDIKCGYFFGEADTLPPKGPLRGAEVAWSYTGTFEQHFPQGNVPKRTDANGNAVMELGVKSEAVPGLGPVVRREGTIEAKVSPNLRAAPVALSQPWAVEYHRHLGFKFSGLKWRISLCCDGSPDFGVATYEVTHARKCSDNPLDPLWAVILHEVANWPGGGGPGYVHDGPVSGHWNPGGQITFDSAGFGPTPVITLTKTNGQWQASASTSVPVITVLNGGPVKVEEDLDNGAFTWDCSQVNPG
jgi:hypothetical protein